MVYGNKHKKYVISEYLAQTQDSRVNLAQIAREFERKFGVSITPNSIRYILKRKGIELETVHGGARDCSQRRAPIDVGLVRVVKKTGSGAKYLRAKGHMHL